jgi:hypothetical protein
MVLFITEILVPLMIEALILIYIGVKFKTDGEANYPLYIFLYFIISAFKLSLQYIPIPLGFIICLIYFQSHPAMKNRRAKKLAMIVGIFAFVAGCFLPSIKI